ncbi:thioredoxin family protein [Actinocorallia sp. A-T 12471]|uniref:thioredoxin family protein n=1 Tax=Actinocorallia sp. A-T 12471 TaxID=3089813 RepID=UPI0029CD1E02|nr:thioredoxin family protein [Actinocorallia sp. A-T 12471]MDX6739884.1 thioredoxin family protein [Actinocorallia sp. A-T 12471]
MAIQSFLVPLGTPAPAFSLPDLDGTTVTLSAADEQPLVLVVFLSNHCPYVRRIEKALGSLTAKYARLGVATFGISANDAVTYPDDSPAHLAEQAERAGFTFPYLYDESQDVARAYRAACTPDFFLYGPDRRLVYRGEFDGARPSNDVPATGETLRAALDLALAGRPVPEPHTPSLGCGIKWRPED